MTIMSSYNVNNGVPAANDYNMLEDMVRGEWGFDGLVETDWGGSGGYTIPRAMHDGNDLIMPGGSAGATVISAIADIPSIFEQPVYDIVRQENGSYVITSTGETIDTGYPGVTISSWWGIMNATTLWNDFALDAQGSITIEKEVSIESYETQNIPQIENDQAFFVSLKELADQNDAIEAMIDGETVKVIYHGDYTANTLSLGDVQKSAMRILQVVLASQGFEEYSGETAVGYTTARADRLTDYCVVEKN